MHGNTLTAAVMINKIPKEVTEIFLTGATSKLGRAIGLYLCTRGVRVLVSLLEAKLSAPVAYLVLLGNSHVLLLTIFADVDHLERTVRGNPVRSCSGTSTSADSSNEISGRQRF